jgi:hypothetical protein
MSRLVSTCFSILLNKKCLFGEPPQVGFALDRVSKFLQLFQSIADRVGARYHPNGPAEIVAVNLTLLKEQVDDLRGSPPLVKIDLL